MSAVLTLPRLGETMEEGRIVAWLVAPGTTFQRGDVLAEIETDKMVVEVPALSDGEMVEILVSEGEMVRVGDPIARLGGEGDAPVPSSAPVTAPSAVLEPTLAAPGPEKDDEALQPACSERPRATPVARRLARAAGLDIAALPGSGRRGRIERADVERALADGSSAMTGSASDASLRAAHGLAYQLNGPEAGKPVVLVHGLAGDHTVWASVATGLARAGRRVLVVDLPAHGNATAEAAAPDELAGGLADLVAETLGDASSVISHSLGAVPAIALAEAGRARNLTLVAPVGLGVHIDRDFVLGLAAASAPGEVSHLLARMTDGPLPLSEDAVAEIATTLAKGRLMKLAGSIVGETGQAVDLRPALARLAETMPVRILAPHRDRIVDWRDALTVSPRIAIHHLPRAGHLAWWDAPRDVLAILMAATEE